MNETQQQLLSATSATVCDLRHHDISRRVLSQTDITPTSDGCTRTAGIRLTRKTGNHWERRAQHPGYTMVLPIIRHHLTLVAYVDDVASIALMIRVFRKMPWHQLSSTKWILWYAHYHKVVTDVQDILARACHLSFRLKRHELLSRTGEQIQTYVRLGDVNGPRRYQIQQYQI